MYQYLVIIFFSNFMWQIGDDFVLEVDILEKYKQFNTPVADQMGHNICGPLSICDNLGITFSIQTGLENPVIGSQEVTDWMQLFQPFYYMNKKRPKRFN